MRTRIVSDVRFKSRGDYTYRAGVIVKEWDDEPEVVHWTDRDGLHLGPMPDDIYRDMLCALAREGLDN